MYRQDVSNVLTIIKKKIKFNQTDSMRNLKFDKGINDFYFANCSWYNGIKFRK